ncbi:fatty acyl-CoA reductase wat-like [Anopheles ziemanni]|uniref:fatty acyl-CoA reductase wat-like n=1 Tax=Anopheles coustani TaxID=139045 RepID=UPI00265B71CE|nr:fatty acyl-CoA reductase wat-like [Anopheles coustani]XP_058170377.1 fatty acyl-CoA reductase wat-like [Anopheles ziemanni]
MGDLGCVPGAEGAIRKYYRNKTVLITGGTGFIGKVLLEKLLRCFEVNKVFLLVRPKRNRTVTQRLEDVFEDVVFDNLKASPGGGKPLLSKVIPIEVNFQSDKVISAESQRVLAAEVEIVFNVMASVKFNEDIDTALDTNVVSSRKLLLMVEQFPALQSIVHVSTFFSNCHRSHIEERIYGDLPFGGFENILRLFEHLSAAEKDALKPLILGPMPNSYTFSKRCAEVMIHEQFAHLPIAVFRPPIVSSAYREPSPGWVNNFNGPAGLVVCAIRGQVFWCYGADDATVHMVPVDYCVNALLAVGWNNAQRTRTEGLLHGELVPVYNYAFRDNLIRNRDAGALLARGIDSWVGRIFGRYTIHITSSMFMRKLFICYLLLQATIADLVRMFTGKKQIHYTNIKRLVNLDDSTSYFRCHSWTVENGNIRRLWDRVSPEEKRLLPFDVETLDWKDYFRYFVKGVAAALQRMRIAKRQC